MVEVVVVDEVDGRGAAPAEVPLDAEPDVPPFDKCVPIVVTSDGGGFKEPEVAAGLDAVVDPVAPVPADAGAEEPVPVSAGS